jgi:hypothetical protein
VLVSHEDEKPLVLKNIRQLIKEKNQ